MGPMIRTLNLVPGTQLALSVIDGFSLSKSLCPIRERTKRLASTGGRYQPQTLGRRGLPHTAAFKVHTQRALRANLGAHALHGDPASSGPACASPGWALAPL